jgi:hypothetical protein
MKAQVDSSSRGQKDFICREEKDCMAGNAEGPGNPWLWVRLGIGFCSLFYIA